MGFQTGTQVDPRLMRADLSGFTKAAEMQAEGMKSFAASLGGGIAKFAEKKEKKKKEDAGVAFATEWATNNPEMAQAMGFDVTDDEGFFDANNIEKSAREFYKTVGDEGFKSVIPQLLALGVKSDATAAEMNKQTMEELKDLEGFRKITGYVEGLDDLRLRPSTPENSTGGSFVLERKVPGAFNLQEGIRLPKYEVVQYDDPEAAMIAGRPGSHAIFGSTGSQMQRGQFPGARIPRRPEVPVGDTSDPVPPTSDPNDPAGLFN